MNAGAEERDRALAEVLRFLFGIDYRDYNRKRGGAPMQLRKIEHPNGKSFYWACNGPDCPYESAEIKYTMDNYHATPPPFCPRCGRSGNLQAAMMSEGISAGQRPTKLGVSPGEVGHWGHDMERE